MDKDIRAIHEKLDIINERLERFERVGTKRDHDLGFASKEITKRMVWQSILWVVAGFLLTLVIAWILGFEIWF